MHPIGAIMIDTTPIFTIPSISIEVTTTQELMVSQEAYTSSLPLGWYLKYQNERNK